MFEYQVNFIKLGCSNSAYYNCTWLTNNYSGFFYLLIIQIIHSRL